MNIKDIIQPKTFLQPLKEVVVETNFNKISQGKGRLVRVRDLKQDVFDYNIVLSELEELSFESRKGGTIIEIDQKVLLIATVMGQLRPSLCVASKDHSFFVQNSSSIKALVVDESKIYIPYLILQLHKPYFLESLKNVSKGKTLIRYNYKDILEIGIKIPDGSQEESLEEQQRIWELEKRAYDYALITKHKMQETIDTILKEQLNQRQWQLHDLRNNQLLELKTRLMVLNKLAQKSKGKYQDFTVSDDEGNLYDYIAALNSNVSELANRIETIWNPTVMVAEKKKIDVLQFLQNFKDTQTVLSRDLFVYDNTSLESLTRELEEVDGEGERLYIEFDADNLEQIFENIFANISKHAGFKAEHRATNKVEIRLELKDDLLYLTVANTGDEVAISTNNYFMEGGRAGRFAGSGFGGHIIKQNAEANDAKAILYISNDLSANEYVFRVGIKTNYSIE